jgi:hypothetical protein
MAMRTRIEMGEEMSDMAASTEIVRLAFVREHELTTSFGA